MLYGRSDEDALAPYQPFAEMIGALRLARRDRRRSTGELGPPRGARRPARGAPRLPAARVPPASSGRRALPPVRGRRLGAALAVAGRRRARAGVRRPAMGGPADAPAPAAPRARAVPERLLVVGTYRDEEVARESPLAELIASSGAISCSTVVALGGPRRGRDRQARGACPAAAARRLRDADGGNPLFLGELLRALAEAGGEGMDSERALDDLGVPEGVSDVVLRSRRAPRRAGTRSAHAGGGRRPAGSARALELAAEASPEHSRSTSLERAVAARLLATHSSVPTSVLRARARCARPSTRAGRGQAASAPPARRGDARGAAGRAATRSRASWPITSSRRVTWAASSARSTTPGRRPTERRSRSRGRTVRCQLERALEADRLREPSDPADRAELLLALGEALHARRARNGPHGRSRRPPRSRGDAPPNSSRAPRSATAAATTRRE